MWAGDTGRVSPLHQSQWQLFSEQRASFSRRAQRLARIRRSLGVDAVLEVIAGQGDLWRFRIFQRQPEWKEQGNEAQLRRWLGTTARRKNSYARLLVNALDLERVPAPLDRLLARV